jgi:hypothetical protein
MLFDNNYFTITTTVRLQLDFPVHANMHFKVNNLDVSI